MKEAVVIAGGFGTRLRQVVSDLPKPMALVAGRPFLQIVLSMLARSSFDRVVLSLGFMAEKISGYFGQSFRGIDLVYEVEHQPLGTGGAVRAALARCQSDHAFVLNGDTYIDLETRKIEALWQKTHRPILVACEVSDTTRYGRINVEDSRVTGFCEKGVAGPGVINAGCYVLPVNALDEYEIGQPFSFEREFLPKAVAHNYLDAFVTRGKFIDIGIPEDYARAQEELGDVEKQPMSTFKAS